MKPDWKNKKNNNISSNVNKKCKKSKKKLNAKNVI